MAETTFVWNNARITIHALTAEDELDAEIDAELIRGDAAYELRGNYKRQQVAECWRSVSAIDGNLGFVVPNENTTPEELREAYQAFLESNGLLKTWRAALRSIEVEKK